MPTPSPYVELVERSAAIGAGLEGVMGSENCDIGLWEDGTSVLKALQLRAPDAIMQDLQDSRHVLTRDETMDFVWGCNFDSGTYFLAVLIRHLRRKLEQVGEERLIQTVRGGGYARRNS